MRQVGRITARQQGQRIQRARNGVLIGVIRGTHAGCDHLAALLEDAFRLCAIKRRCRRVAAKHRQLQNDVVRLSRTPACELQFAATGLCFRRRECLTHFGARIDRKCLATDSEDHITHGDHAISRRLRLHFRDGDLSRITRHQRIRVHPSPQACGTEIPVVFGFGRDRIALGEIGWWSGFIFACCKRGGREGKKQEGQFHWLVKSWG